MPRFIPIILSLDDSEPMRKVAALEARFNRLNSAESKMLSREAKRTGSSSVAQAELQAAQQLQNAEIRSAETTAAALLRANQGVLPVIKNNYGEAAKAAEQFHAVEVKGAESAAEALKRANQGVLPVIKGNYEGAARAAESYTATVISETAKQEAAFVRMTEEQRRSRSALASGQPTFGQGGRGGEVESAIKQQASAEAAALAQAEAQRVGKAEASAAREVAAINAQTRKQAQFTEDLIFKSKQAEEKLAGSVLKAEHSLTNATSAFARAEKSAGGLTGQLAALSGQSNSTGGALSALGGGAGLAAAAIAVIAAVTVGAAFGLFQLAQGASETGEAIFDISQRTQLSAEFLSVLKVEAEQSGSTLEASATKLVKFNNSLVDAANGSKKLTSNLLDFGIKAKEAVKNPEQALISFIQKFNSMPAGIKKSRLEATLFKDRTGEIVPVLKAFGTNVDGLQKKLADMGLVWTADGIKKADEFSDALVQLGQRFEGIKNTIAREAMPEITRAMNDLSNWLTKNKSEWMGWVDSIGTAISFARHALDAFALYLKSPLSPFAPIYWVTVGIRYLSKQGVSVQAIEALVNGKGDSAAGTGTGSLVGGLAGGTLGGTTKLPEGALGGGGGGRHKGGGKSAAEKAAEEAIKLAEIQLRGVERIGKQINSQLQRDVETRGSLRAADMKTQLDAETKIYDAKMAVLGKKDAEIRFEKNARVRATKELELAEECEQIQADFQEAATKIAFDGERKRIETMSKGMDERYKLLADKYDSQAALIQSDEMRQVLGAEQTARRLKAIAIAQHRDQIEQLQNKRDLFDAESEEYKRLTFEIGVAENNLGYIIKEHDRDIREERKKDLADLRSYRQQMLSIELETSQKSIEIGRRRLDQLEKLGGSRRGIKAGRKDLDFADEGLRFRKEISDILSQDASTPRKGSPEQKAALDNLFKERIELAKESHAAILKEMNDAPIVEKLEKIRGYAKGVGDAFADAIVNSQGKISNVFKALEQDFASFLKSLIREIISSKIKEWIVSIFNPSAAGGNGGKAGGGGWLSSLKSLFNSGGQGSSTGSNSGGLLGTFKNLLGLGGSGAATSAAAGAGGSSIVSGGLAGAGLGLNAFAAPSAISAIAGSGGLAGAAGLAAPVFGGGTFAGATLGAGTLFGAGGTLAAGAGAAGAAGVAGAGGAATGAAAGGASGFGALMPLLTNPWTAVAVGAAVGGLLLWKHFHHSSEDKIKKAIKAQYGISINDKSIPRQIKDIGIGLYGKHLDSHINELIARDEVKEIIKGYAESTGQEAKGLTTNAEYGSETFAGNQFVAGRPVAGSPPSSSGSSASGGGSSFSGGSARPATSARDAMIAALIAANTEAMNRVAASVETIDTADPDALFIRSTERNPEAVGKANNVALKSGSVRAGAQEALGMRND